MTAGLIETAQALVGAGRGLLAMDESNSTCDKRFAKVGIAETLEMRRAYREMLITTHGLTDYFDVWVYTADAWLIRDAKAPHVARENANVGFPLLWCHPSRPSTWHMPSRSSGFPTILT